MGTFLQLLLLAAVVDNLVLARLFGLPALVADHAGQAGALHRRVAGTSLAVLIVIPAAWMLQHYLLQPWRLEHLRVLLLALLALLAAAAMTRVFDLADAARGRHDEVLRVAGTVVLLGAVLSPASVVGDSLLHACARGLGTAVGFAIAAHALDAIGERLATAPVPAAFRGLPVSLLAAGLFALGLGAFAAGGLDPS